MRMKKAELQLKVDKKHKAKNGKTSWVALTGSNNNMLPPPPPHPKKKEKRKKEPKRENKIDEMKLHENNK